MKGLDLLAAACAPQDTETPATPAQVILSEDQCNMIAAKVIETLQGQHKSDPAPVADPEPAAGDPEPQEGGLEDAAE